MNGPAGSATIPPETFLHLTTTGWTAIGSMVSAVSIVVLAIFNFLYLKAARRQAGAAEQTLRELQYQFTLQQIGQKETALATVLEVARNALSWRESLHTERSLNDRAVLMPPNWPSVMAFVGQQIPAVITEMTMVDREMSETERLLNEVVHMPLSMRSGQLIGQKISPLRGKLRELGDDSQKIAETLRNWRSPSSRYKEA
jgi:hypothetical protein